MVPFGFEHEGAPSSAPCPVPTPISFQTTSSASTPNSIAFGFLRELKSICLFAIRDTWKEISIMDKEEAKDTLSSM